jgi:GAF domain-containing protein
MKDPTVIKATPPLNEAERLEILRQYRILDTEREPAFDDIAMLAAHVCDTPMAMVSLVDEKRQWFKARVGLEVQETTRDVAFCAHAILESEVMVVPDALHDQRFAQNPLVTDDPQIRFYAGAPLITPSGHGLGTLCVVDRNPRTLSDDKVKALQALARQVVTQMDLRKSSRVLADALERVRSLRELLPICSYCKRIRDDDQYWQEVEGYLRNHAGAEFTHGICPSCEREHFPDLERPETREDAAP